MPGALTLETLLERMSAGPARALELDEPRIEVGARANVVALDLIAQAGGGEVVSFPNELTPGKKTSSSFLHNGTRAMFEKAGFTFERHIGKSKTVMRKTVPEL